MRRLSHVVATVTSVALVALTSGCGGDNPAPSAAPKQPPASSASASATPPAAPESIQTKDRRGATDAVRHFLTTMRYAGDSGETTAFRESFAGTCTKCRAIADGIEQTYAAGGSIRGGAWNPTRIKFYGIARNVASLDVVVDYERQEFIAERGASPDIAPRQVGILKAFQVTWDGTWKVGALDPEA